MTQKHTCIHTQYQPHHPRKKRPKAKKGGARPPPQQYKKGSCLLLHTLSKTTNHSSLGCPFDKAHGPKRTHNNSPPKNVKWIGHAIPLKKAQSEKKGEGRPPPQQCKRDPSHYYTLFPKQLHVIPPWATPLTRPTNPQGPTIVPPKSQEQKRGGRASPPPTKTIEKGILLLTTDFFL